MLINSAKINGMMFSRLGTAWPTFPDLFVGSIIVKMVSELKILGVVIDSKQTFVSHARSVAASGSRRIGISRKTRSVFRDSSIVSCCFRSFILPVIENCSPVWMSAAVSHLSLLDQVVRIAFRLSGGVVRCDLWHRRRFVAVSVQ